MNARVRALAVLLAVFLIGASGGVIGHRYYNAKTQAVSAPPPSKADRPQRPRLQDVLNMTPEQKSKFAEIWKEFRPQFEALREEQEKKFDAVRADFDPRYEELRAEVNRRIVSILNEEQKQKFDAMQKEMSTRRGRRPPYHPGLPPERPGGPPSQK